MFGTWERAHTGRWQRAAEHPRRAREPMSEFLSNVDVMLYVASAALAVCIVALLVT
ncbi:MAG TPA: hypothetical protein VGP15_07900 [Burkholderiales bacterium]|jgi:hypothetical protein|nr:hypothetical protein [Burkholderiales bacterium]